MNPRENCGFATVSPYCLTELIGDDHRRKREAELDPPFDTSRKADVREPTATPERKQINCDLGQDDVTTAQCIRIALAIGICKAMLDKSAGPRNPACMIGSIRHKALWNYWTKGQTRGLNAKWIRKLRRILAALEAADEPEEMSYPGSYFHSLKGDRTGRYASQPTFASPLDGTRWNEDGAAEVDIEDYH